MKPPVADVDPVLLMASASAASFRTVSVRAGMLAPWTRETSSEFLKTMNVGMLLSISKGDSEILRWCCKRLKG